MAALALSFTAINSEKAYAYEKVSGKFKNVAVVVEFSDTDDKDKVTESAMAKLSEAFNGDEKSLKNYIEKHYQTN